MISDRTTARIVGILYIIGTVAGVLSAIVSAGLLDGADYLSVLAASAGRAQLVALLVLVMGIALAMVPALMYPILKRQNEALAIGYVIFRGALEGLVYILTAMTWFLLVIVARQYADSGAAVAAQFSSLGILLVKAQDPINAITCIVFSLGGLMLYYLLYQMRLIPRWISGWGIVAAMPYLAAGLIAVFGPYLVPLMLPLALQEMVMAVWLIARGFSQPASDPTAAGLASSGAAIAMLPKAAAR